MCALLYFYLAIVDEAVFIWREINVLAISANTNDFSMVRNLKSEAFFAKVPHHRPSQWENRCVTAIVFTYSAGVLLPRCGINHGIVDD
jgi:hypothetical protein